MSSGPSPWNEKPRSALVTEDGEFLEYLPEREYTGISEGKAPRLEGIRPLQRTYVFERAGMLPALVVLVLISSLGGEEFKLTEVIGNMVVLTILCVIVFKLGLGMNISVIQGVW